MKAQQKGPKNRVFSSFDAPSRLFFTLPFLTIFLAFSLLTLISRGSNFKAYIDVLSFVTFFLAFSLTTLISRGSNFKAYIDILKMNKTILLLLLLLLLLFSFEMFEWYCEDSFTSILFCNLDLPIPSVHIKI